MSHKSLFMFFIIYSKGFIWIYSFVYSTKISHQCFCLHLNLNATPKSLINSKNFFFTTLIEMKMKAFIIIIILLCILLISKNENGVIIYQIFCFLFWQLFQSQLNMAFMNEMKMAFYGMSNTKKKQFFFFHPKKFNTKMYHPR